MKKRKDTILISMQYNNNNNNRQTWNHDGPSEFMLVSAVWCWLACIVVSSKTLLLNIACCNQGESKKPEQVIGFKPEFII